MFTTSKPLFWFARLPADFNTSVCLQNLDVVCSCRTNSPVFVGYVGRVGLVPGADLAATCCAQPMWHGFTAIIADQQERTCELKSRATSDCMLTCCEGFGAMPDGVCISCGSKVCTLNEPRPAPLLDASRLSVFRRVLLALAP